MASSRQHGQQVRPAGAPTLAPLLCTRVSVLPRRVACQAVASAAGPSQGGGHWGSALALFHLQQRGEVRQLSGHLRHVSKACCTRRTAQLLRPTSAVQRSAALRAAAPAAVTRALLRSTRAPVRGNRPDSAAEASRAGHQRAYLSGGAAGWSSCRRCCLLGCLLHLGSLCWLGQDIPQARLQAGRVSGWLTWG